MNSTEIPDMDLFADRPPSLSEKAATSRTDREARRRLRTRPLIYANVRDSALRALLCATAAAVVRDHRVTGQNFAGRLLAGLHARRAQATPDVAERLGELERIVSDNLRTAGDLYGNVTDYMHDAVDAATAEATAR